MPWAVRVHCQPASQWRWAGQRGSGPSTFGRETWRAAALPAGLCFWQPPAAWRGQPPPARTPVSCSLLLTPQYYDVTGQGTNDYPVTDLLQMMGRASRPLTDEQGM